MALKPDRSDHLEWELGYYMNVVANPGICVSISTAASGANLDSDENVAVAPADSSGALPLGILMNEVVNNDQTRVLVNHHKHQNNVGDKVPIVRKGWVVTDRVVGTPTAGQYAVLASSGLIAGVDNINSHDQHLQPVIGRFLSDSDSEGYNRLRIDL